MTAEIPDILIAKQRTVAPQKQLDVLRRLILDSYIDTDTCVVCGLLDSADMSHSCTHCEGPVCDECFPSIRGVNVLRLRLYCSTECAKHANEEDDEAEVGERE